MDELSRRAAFEHHLLSAPAARNRQTGHELNSLLNLALRMRRNLFEGLRLILGVEATAAALPPAQAVNA